MAIDLRSLAASPRAWLAAVWSVFQLYTAQAGLFDLLIQLPLHVMFAVALGFLSPPTGEGPGGAAPLPRWRRGLDGGAALLAIACGLYYVVHLDRLVTRMPLVDDPRRLDIVVALVFMALLLEASRRHIGSALVLLALAFIAYAFVGPWLPGFLGHGGVGFRKFVDQQMLTTEAVFGIPTLVSATFIYLFVLLGSVMEHGGLMRLFTDAALAITGASRGGAGKVAVLASGALGTINGSAIANSVTSGAFTIPLMVKAGYRPAFAAAVESTSSMGAQLAPPVLGAAAFIMAETLGIPYLTIALAATIPSVLYFVAVGSMVHFEAVRRGLPVISRADLPRLWPVLRRDGHLLIGPIVLTWLLIEGRSPMFAGFWGLVVSFVASAVRRETRIGPRAILRVLLESAYNALPVALACATVGIVVGVVSITGLGLKLASGILGISGGNLFVTLLLTMIAALVLGTGLPTSATYIITAIMAAPALVQLGVPKLVAHMFVFYFGILADLTPPTAISTYATSSIAGADVWRTQWLAMMLALSGFLIPFSFVYDPAMLLVGAGVAHVLLSSAAAGLGVVMLGAGLIGYLTARTRLWERGALLVGGFLLIFPGALSYGLGALAFASVWLAQRTAARRAAVSA